MAKNKTIKVRGTIVSLYENRDEDYISLTDIARYRDSERSDYILQNWMRNRNSIEFDGIKNMAGSNSFSLTPKRWIEITNAIGIISETGYYFKR